jgi:hypothetical protein
VCEQGLKRGDAACCYCWAVFAKGELAGEGTKGERGQEKWGLQECGLAALLPRGSLQMILARRSKPYAHLVAWFICHNALLCLLDC